MIDSAFPTWLEVNLDAVGHNTRYAAAQLKQAAMMAVVKANAYGLGAVEIARTALQNGASWLGVARYCEARSLRKAGITAPILVFGMATPTEVEEAIQHDVTLTLHSFEALNLYAQKSRAAQKPLKVHLKLDSGFGRLGVLPEEILPLAQQAAQQPFLVTDGLYSHLAMADEKPGHPVTQAQIQAFENALKSLRENGIHLPWIHLGNSAAAFGLPEVHYNLVRVGTALLGMKPFYFLPFPAELRRVVQWKAQLASCKHLPAGWGVSYGHEYVTTANEWIGALPVGYGDGFRRLPGNEVLIGGLRVPVVGRVCNDQCMIHLPRAFPAGSEVVLIGEQGSQAIYTDELVGRWHTSQADIISNINLRVPRIYTRDDGTYFIKELDLNGA